MRSLDDEHPGDAAGGMGTVSSLDVPGASSNQALARGLYVLRRLVESPRPMSATELAKELGLHQSSISRVMATLGEAGYVRKNERGQFVPDYGVITLAAETTRLPLLTRPVPVFRALLEKYPTITVTTAMLWRSEMLYLVRSNSGSIVHTYEYHGYALNASAPGLRLLLDLPEDEALALLAESRERRGWGGNPRMAPADELSTLQEARKCLDHDVLILDSWYDEGQLSGAIPVRTPEPHPVTLAIVVSDGSQTPDSLRLLLHEVRRDLEDAFSD